MVERDRLSFGLLNSPRETCVVKLRCHANSEVPSIDGTAGTWTLSNWERRAADSLSTILRRNRSALALPTPTHTITLTLRERRSTLPCWMATRDWHTLV